MENWNTISENILNHYVVVGANTQTNLRQRQITGSKTNEDLPCVCAFSDRYVQKYCNRYLSMVKYSNFLTLF